MSEEDLIELVDDAVSWMVSAKKSHPTLLLPAWVAQWQEKRLTQRAPDVLESACCAAYQMTGRHSPDCRFAKAARR